MSKTQLYRWFDKDDNLLYVGISYSAVHRAKEHSRDSHWYQYACKMTLEDFCTREEALIAESRAIQKDNPKFNTARNRLYLLYKDYGYDTLEEYYKDKPNRIKAATKERRKKYNEEHYIENLVDLCEFLRFYSKHWQECIDNNRQNKYPTVKWDCVKTDFLGKVLLSYPTKNHWHELVTQFTSCNNAKERSRLYTKYKSVFQFESKERGLFKHCSCEYDFEEVLCTKAIKILECFNKKGVIDLDNTDKLI